MVKIILMIGALVMLWSSNAMAQERLAVGHLRGRPQEAVPRYSTGKQQPPGLHEGAHPRCFISMPSDAC